MPISCKTTINANEADIKNTLKNEVNEIKPSTGTKHGNSLSLNQNNSNL